MNSIIRSSLLGVLIVGTAAVLFACGDDDVRTREAMPFLRIKLRNTSPPGGPPATATVEGTHMGNPGQTHDVGPVPPEGEGESNPPGTGASDEVAITVSFEGGPTYQGNGSYPGAHISTVDIDCGEPGGGTAKVNFADGRPPENVPLNP